MQAAGGVQRNVPSEAGILSGRFPLEASESSLSVADSSWQPVSACFRCNQSGSVFHLVVMGEIMKTTV